MIDIFEYENYKKFVKNWVKIQPKAGYGQFKKMATYLSVGTVYISQVFKGERQITEDQGLQLAQFLNLLEIETQYFLTLIRKARAGTASLEKYLEKERLLLKQKSQNLSERISSDKDLDEPSKSIFYSNWTYSAIRLATDIPGLNDIAKLSDHLQIEHTETKEIVEFLVDKGLCKLKDGQLQMGPQVIFISADSPHTLSRQRSWRIKGFEQMDKKNKNDLFFTCPLVSSQESIKKIKKRILKLIEETLDEVKDAPSEQLACLNIDLFRI